MKPVIQRLFLAAPVNFTPSAGDPFAKNGYFNIPEPVENSELVFCYSLNPEQAMEFDPDEKGFINGVNSQVSAIEQGNYLFCQEEGYLSKERIVFLAVELQKEGLWQRLIPDDHFFLRFIKEENRLVTQIFRPYRIKVSTI